MGTTLLKFVKLSIGLAMVLLVGVFAGLTAYYSDIPIFWGRLIVTVVVGLTIGWLLFFRPLWKGCAIALGLLILALGLRWQQEPSNDRIWREQNQVLARLDAGIDNQISVKNVRNFRAGKDAGSFTVKYEDRTFDIRKVKTVDFVISYWGEEEGRIAHTFLSFGFEDNQWLSVSIEIRAESDEDYHPIPGLFQQYELIYVVADERDTIGNRIEKGETVYLYRSVASPEQSQKLLMEMLKRADHLAREPEFYGTLGANCTTALITHVNSVLESEVPFSRQIVLNGLSDRFAYERGYIRNQLPFYDLKSACRVDAEDISEDANFSRIIRDRRVANLKALK